jgi:hypothetical protein
MARRKWTIEKKNDLSIKPYAKQKKIYLCKTYKVD